MALVAFWVVLATTVGVACELRTSWAAAVARRLLGLMLYVLLPFVAYVSFAHLQLSLGAGVGLGVAYVGLGLAGLCALALGRRLELGRPSQGGLILSVIVVNSGYLGYPVCTALLGANALNHAVVYDQVVSVPFLFTAGFAVGAAFGTAKQISRAERVRNFLTRNPPLIAAVVGLLVPRELAPQVLVSASHVVVDGLLVVGFFTVGVYLSSERREGDTRLLSWPDRTIGAALLARFCVNPALLGLVSLAGVGIPSAYLLQALMPTGVNALVIGNAYGLDQRLIATVIVWTTIAVLVVGTVVSIA